MGKNLTIGKLNIGQSSPTAIALSIAKKTKNEILEEAMKIVSSKPDIVEWRADYYEYCNDYNKDKSLLIELKEILNEVPIIITIRTTEEGGLYSNGVNDYSKLLVEISRMNIADSIDVEFNMADNYDNALVKELRKSPSKIILSYHNFNETLSESAIKKILMDMQNLGADAAKIAMMPISSKDVDILRQALASVVLHIPSIVISMGDIGKTSRYRCKDFKSCISFATYDKPIAPGQIQIDELRLLMQE